MDFENQQMIETLFAKRQRYPLVRREIEDSPALMEKIEKSSLTNEFLMDLLTHLLLRGKAEVTEMIGVLAKHYSGRLQETADALMEAVVEDFADFNVVTGQFTLKYRLPQKVLNLIEQYQYLPPMVVPPLEVTSNRGSGYIQDRSDSLLLKDNHHEGDLCLDHLNRCNAVPLAIDTRIVKGIRNQWKNLNKAKPGESYEDFMARVQSFKVFEKKSFDTMALMVEMGNRFYLTHKYDKRGRTYAMGYHVSTQGNDWNKAVVCLADKELITD